MNSDRAVLLAIVLVIAATAVGIYTENKSTQAKNGLMQLKGRPLAN